MTQISNIIGHINERIWRDDPEKTGGILGTLLKLLRVSILLVRNFNDRNTRLRAMGLVYLTLLSVVPLLAITFSLLRAFGIHNKFRDVLLTLVEPLGEQGSEVVDYVLEFVGSMQMEGLGIAGGLVLVISVISALQMVEAALNDVWHVRTPRRLVSRISTYSVIIIVGPLLGFSAMAFMTGISSSGFMVKFSEVSIIGEMVAMSGRTVPFFLACAGFTFLFMFMPNTRVKPQAAFLAALISAVFWIIIGIVFSALVVTSARYAAIYSAFASMVLFMMWTFMSWMVVLIGARGSYLLQHPDYIVEKAIDLELSIEQEERLALRVLQLVGRHFYGNKKPWSLEALASYLKVPWLSLERMLIILEHGRYLTRTSDGPGRFVPGKPFEEVKLAEVLSYIRNKTPGRQASGFRGDRSPMLNKIVRGAEDASNQTLSDMTLKDLAQEDGLEN